MSARLRSTVAPPTVRQTTEVTDQQPAAPASIAPNVISQLDPSRNTDSNTGHLAQLEWVIDFRFPLLSWLYSLSHIVTNTMYLSSSYASPASALGYTVIMITALFYHTDAAHLHATSPAATAILNDAILSRFFDMLLDLPVPDFAHNEFADLQAFLPDDAPALAILSCLASTDYFYDFGRHFSANVFFLAHNLLSTLPGNTATNDLRSRFYTSVVNTVNIGNNQNANITPANLFNRINGNVAVSNWLNERIDAMINAMAIRAVNQNNVVAQINFPTVALGSTTDYNPYTFLTCASHATIHSVTSAVKDLATWIGSTFPASRPLRHYLQPGSHLTSYYLYTDVALPTWNTTATTHSGTTMPTTVQSDTEFADNIGFLNTPTVPTATEVNGTTVFNMAMTRDAATPPENPTYARLQSTTPARATPYVNPISYLSYQTARHMLPRTYIYAPYSIQTGDLGSVILSGKWIETGDISGIMMTVPTPATGLLYENAQFFDGAIRLSRCRQALYHPGTKNPVQVRPRRTNLNAPAAFFRGIIHRLRAPAARTGPVRAPASANSDNQRTLPGSQLAIDPIDYDHSMNFFGNNLSNDLSLHSDTKFSIWSGLRFRYHTGTSHVIYVLPTARHIYGAKARSYGTVHPALRLPL